MAENRAVAAGQDSSHPSSLPGNPANPDDVDASVNFMQLSALKAADNRPPPHPKREQLPPADHAMLSLSHPRHLMIKRSSVKLGTPVVPKSPLSSHSGNPGAERRTRGAQFVPTSSTRA